METFLHVLIHILSLAVDLMAGVGTYLVINKIIKRRDRNPINKYHGFLLPDANDPGWVIAPVPDDSVKFVNGKFIIADSSQGNRAVKGKANIWVEDPYNTGKHIQLANLDKKADLFLTAINKSIKEHAIMKALDL